MRLAGVGVALRLQLKPFGLKGVNFLLFTSTDVLSDVESLDGIGLVIVVLAKLQARFASFVRGVLPAKFNLLQSRVQIVPEGGLAGSKSHQVF